MLLPLLLGQGTASPNYTLTCQAGSYTVTGVSAVLLKKRTLTASAGSYTQTGVSAILKKGRTLTASAGSYSLTGVSVTLSKNRKLTANAGSYSLTGVSATLLRSKLITAQAGAYSQTGVSANITYTPGSVNYTLTAQSGSYSLTGISATLSKGRKLTASAGSYAQTGVSAVVKLGKVLTASAGSYAITGQSATITKSGTAANYTLTCQTGSYLIGADYWDDGYAEPGYAGNAVITISPAGSPSAEVELSPRRKWYVKRGKQILIFEDAQEADAFIEAEKQADEAIKAAQKTSRRARKRLRERVYTSLDAKLPEVVQIDMLGVLVEQYAIPVDLPRLIANQDLEELVRIALLAQDMQDEDDIEMLLLA